MRPFATTKSAVMCDHLRPTLRDIVSDLFIVHVGAIDVPSSKINNEVDEDIVKLAETIKANIGSIATSNIAPWEDNCKTKVEEVNEIFYFCQRNYSNVWPISIIYQFYISINKCLQVPCKFLNGHLNSNLEILILEFYQNKKWLYKFPNQVDMSF